MTEDDRSYKRAVLCEELFELCRHDDLMALCLRQMLYWLPRTRTIDRYIEEETARQGNDEAGTAPTGGWVYKTAEQLKGEIMTGRSRKAVSMRLCSLVEQGWLERRQNPIYKWDRTWQYRVNLLKLEADLNALGYSLATVMGQDFRFVAVLHGVANDPSTGHGVQSEGNGVQSEGNGVRALPETLSETPHKEREIPPAFGNPLYLPLAQACSIMPGAATDSQKTQLSQVMEILAREGATPGQMDGFRPWWNINDYRGKTAPYPPQVQEKWGAYMEYWCKHTHDPANEVPLIEQI